jgi:hypothetical protein
VGNQQALEAGEKAALQAYSERAEGRGTEADCLRAAAAYRSSHAELSADDALQAVSRLVRTLGQAWRNTFVRRDRDREWSR